MTEAEPLPMPDDESDELSSPSPTDEPARPSFGRQVLQLVLIPALIVLAAVAVAYPIIRMVQVDASTESHLMALSRRGGLENDKWRAIHALATHVGSIKDSKLKSQLSEQLITVLRDSPAGEDGKIHRGIILLVARLQQPDSLEVIRGYGASEHVEVRRAVAMALLGWQDHEAARGAIGDLVVMADDPDVHVKGYAAKVLGTLAVPGDPGVVKSLLKLLDSDVLGAREASWDAAVALARMGNARASMIVADLLLDRQSLGQLPANPGTVGEGGTAARAAMGQNKQTMILLATLSAAGQMTDARVWDKIKRLADSDTNIAIRTAATQLLLQRRQIEKLKKKTT